MGDLRIIFRQILPNALAPIIVTASIMVATAILTESALAFLGLGDPNVMSWGSMIGAGREMLRTRWYLTAIPGLAILLDGAGPQPDRRRPERRAQPPTARPMIARPAGTRPGNGDPW